MKKFSSIQAETAVIAYLFKNPRAFMNLSEDDFSEKCYKKTLKIIREFTEPVEEISWKMKCEARGFNDLLNMYDVFKDREINDPDTYVDMVLKCSFLNKIKDNKKFYNKCINTIDGEDYMNEWFYNTTLIEIQDTFDEEIYNEIEELDRLINSGEESNYKKIEIRSIREIIETNKDIDPLIEGMFYNNSLNNIVGDAKIGKSYTASQLASALSTGEDFLGHKVIKKMKVLVLDFEQNDNFLAAKGRAAIDLYNNGDYYVASFLDCKHSLDDIVKFVRKAKRKYPEIGAVIFDCYYGFKEGEENSADDVNNTLEKLKRLKKYLNVFYVHHTTKNGVDKSNPGYSASGSGVHYRIVDQSLTLSYDDKTNEGTGYIAGRAWKSEFDFVKNENGALVTEDKVVAYAKKAELPVDESSRLTEPEDLDLNGKRKDKIMVKFPEVTDWDSWAEENGYHWEKLDGKNKFFVRN